MTQRQPAVVMRYQVVCPEAIENCIHEYYPDVAVQIEHVEGLA